MLLCVYLTCVFFVLQHLGTPIKTPVQKPIKGKDITPNTNIERKEVNYNEELILCTVYLLNIHLTPDLQYDETL